jgi:nucleoside-diphosphate-sugar epimerase
MTDPVTRAFVAGATGYTGREIVQVYAERGDTVWAHVRPDSPRLDTWQQRFEAMGADVDITPWDLEAMTDRLRELGPAVVFATLGTTRKNAARDGMAATEAYEKVDYGLTALLIEAAVASECRPRFVYISAAGLNENTRNPYMRARVRAEADLRASGLPFTIVRPSFISGDDRDEDRPAERIAARVGNALLGAAAVFGARKLRDRYAPMTGRQLAEGMIRAAADPEAAGKILHGEDLR